MEGKVIVPDFITPIVGWRFWRICGNELEKTLYLKSIVIQRMWPRQKKMIARCYCPDLTDKKSISIHKDTPNTYSECGIHAYKTIRYALTDMFGELFPRANEMSVLYAGGVLGEIKLWGKVQQHKFGYRAQFAYPQSLIFGICGKCRKIFYLESKFFVFGSEGKILCENCQQFAAKNGIAGDRMLNTLKSNYGLEASTREKLALY